MGLLLPTCDRAPTAVKPTPPPVRPSAHLSVVCQIPPNRTTHVVVDLLGNVLYTSETERGLDGMMIVGETGLPRATELTSVNILSAMGETAGGSGTIQDLAVGPDGMIYFYFVGGKGRTIRACIGRFEVRRQAITIAIDSEKLIRQSGMGDSIALARGNLLPQGNRMSLFLRHFDGWALFHFDPQRISPIAQDPMTRSFTKVIGDTGEMRLTQTRYEFAPGPEQDLLLMDYQTGTLFQVDPTGNATLRAPLTGFPSDLSLPLKLKDNKLMIFAADSPPVAGEVTEFVRSSGARVTYPALLTIDGKKVTSLGRDDLRAYPGFPVYAMRIKELVQAKDGTYVGYDQASGQLMRIQLISQ